MNRRALLAVLALGAWSLPATAVAQKKKSRAILLDRAVVRFTAPEIGGARNPQFIYERTLAFEARVEALSDPGFTARARLPQYIR